MSDIAETAKSGQIETCLSTTTIADTVCDSAQTIHSTLFYAQ